MWFSLLSASQFRWPRGLGLGSSAARLLGLRVRIPQQAWMFVSVSVTCCHVEVTRHSSKGVLTSFCVCLSVIVNPRQWRDPSSIRAVVPWKNIIIIIIIIKGSIFYLKKIIIIDYLQVIQELYVNSNFHCKNSTSCRKGAKYYDCVRLVRSVALSATATNYHCNKPYSLRLSSADIFPFFSPAYRVTKLSPDLHVPTKHTNLQN